jgi:hypothetical protein
MSDLNGLDIEDLIEAASSDDPTDEVAALQDLLRAAWNLMTGGQREALLQGDEAQSLLEGLDEEDGEEEEDERE